MQHHLRFNFFCAVCSAFFIAGTFFMWKRADGEVVVQTNRQQVVLINEQVQMKKTVDQDSENVTAVSASESYPPAVVVATGMALLLETVQKPIPERINLPVPFTSQAPEKIWDQPWQDACEEASLLMIDAYIKKYSLSPLFAKDELLKMVAWEESRGWGTSVSIEKVKAMSEWYIGEKRETGNLKFEIVENPSVENIKRFVADGHPVLVVADGKVLPNPHFRSGGPVYHALVIRGYTEDSFITNDPGTQFGENFVYRYDDLMNALRDWNGGDVKNGRRVVLVVQ